MFTLLSGLWNLLFSKVQYQLLILGLDDAGKTTFLEQLKHLYSGSLPPDELKLPPTVGLNIGKFEVGRTRFLLWDLGGQKSLRILWDKYFSEAHAIVFLVDSTDTARLDENVAELSKLLRDDELADAPLLVLCNKQDLKHALQPDSLLKLLKLPAHAVVVHGGLPSSPAPSAASLTPSPSPLTVATPSPSHATTAALLPSPASTLTPNATPFPSATPFATPFTPAVASPGGASSSSLAASVASSSNAAGNARIIRVFPVCALSGLGLSKVVDALMEIIPRARRTQRITDKV